MSRDIRVTGHTIKIITNASPTDMAKLQIVAIFGLVHNYNKWHPDKKRITVLLFFLSKKTHSYQKRHPFPYLPNFYSLISKCNTRSSHCRFVITLTHAFGFTRCSYVTEIFTDLSQVERLILAAVNIVLKRYPNVTKLSKIRYHTEIPKYA